MFKRLKDNAIRAFHQYLTERPLVYTEIAIMSDSICCVASAMKGSMPNGERKRVRIVIPKRSYAAVRFINYYKYMVDSCSYATPEKIVELWNIGKHAETMAYVATNEED